MTAAGRGKGHRGSRSAARAPGAAGREAVAEAIAHCCRRLWEAGLVAGRDGNVSVRLAADRLLVTPSGVLKSELTAADMVEVDLTGRVRAGFRHPTSELDLHLRVHRRRPDCRAVVHAHPPVATGFALAGMSLGEDLLPEVTVLIGPVPLVPYATPGTPALGDRAEPFLDRHDALLLANHGAVAWGPDLDTARVRMESLEQAARIVLAARVLGRVTTLRPEEVEALRHCRGRSGHVES
ncbi:MAG TPA: class II aldolase/adducin family protein [Gemmatimonadales bacterium]|nr:class II aldolase/adducin family protein [Gemmatimonadales bacterium]